MRYKKNLGDNGEEFAARMLTDAGYEILERNFTAKCGEIDIIAYKDGVLHFVEVKTRTGTDYGFPAEAVTENKISKIRRTAESYINTRKSRWRSVSFDVFEVYANLLIDCM
ncbi:MAG: YraN family protein [Mogibacterium sp.]|nr:YraN family protein [Mogibacterium sp.]